MSTLIEVTCRCGHTDVQHVVVPDFSVLPRRNFYGRYGRCDALHDTAPHLLECECPGYEQTVSAGLWS